MPQAFIGIGSNQGNSEEIIRNALDSINNIPEVEVQQVSSLYLTEPVGFEDQPWFYNCVAEVDTTLSPHKLLEVLQGIENQLGRVRTIRWGPRTVDLDILLYGEITLDGELLTIPHPRMEERAFVIVPLAEIAPGVVIPGGRKVSDVKSELPDDKKCSCIHKKIW